MLTSTPTSTCQHLPQHSLQQVTIHTSHLYQHANIYVNIHVSTSNSINEFGSDLLTADTTKYWSVTKKKYKIKSEKMLKHMIFLCTYSYFIYKFYLNLKKGKLLFPPEVWCIVLIGPCILKNIFIHPPILISLH